MRHLLILAVLLVLVFPAYASSEEAPPQNPWYTTDFLPAQHFTLEPGMDAWLGYRFVGLNGSTRAGVYEYLHSSPAGGLDLHYYPLPYMFDVNVDVKNQYDYNAHASMSFSDLIKLDVRSTALFHNLDHFVLITPGAIDFDPKKDYGVKIHDDEVSFVHKSPRGPYWVYVNYREFHKDGTIQQRFTTNADPQNATTSKSRDINWGTRELTVGTSGNMMGLLEFDYHHILKTFDSDLRNVLGPDTYFLSGAHIHNAVPDFTDNSDTFALHTDLSKPLNASGTFTFGDKKNEYSGANAGFNREYGDLTYRPFDNLLIAFKYGHQKLEVENPKTVTDINFGTSPATFTNPSVFNFNTGLPQKSMSTTRDRGIFAVSYYPMPRLMLLGQYQLDSVERDGVKPWNDDLAADTINLNKESSITHKGSLSATLTPVPHTRLRAGFSYSYNEDPSYIVDFKNQYEGSLWGTWVPIPGLTFNGQYKLLRNNNPDRTAGINLAPFVEPRRHVAKDNAGAGVTWVAGKNLVVGAHYDYLRLRVVQNLYYVDPGSVTVVSPSAPYHDVSHVYAIFANYCFSFPLSLETTFSQSWSAGAYRLDDVLTGPGGGSADTFGLATLTDQYIRETTGTVKAAYKFYRGWGTNLIFGVSSFSDLRDRTYTGARDGTAFFGTVLLTKTWR